MHEIPSISVMAQSVVGMTFLLKDIFTRQDKALTYMNLLKFVSGVQVLSYAHMRKYIELYEFIAVRIKSFAMSTYVICIILHMSFEITIILRVLYYYVRSMT